MARPHHSRWLLLFLSIFFFLLPLAPLQYDPVGDATTKATPNVTERGLQVKLPRFQLFGASVLLKQFVPAIGQHMSSRVEPYYGDSSEAPESTIHLFFIVFILSHILTILLGKKVFHLSDEQITFFSMAYVKLVFGSVFAAILLGIDAWSIFDAIMKHDEIRTWLVENTTLQQPAYITLWGTSVVVVTTLVISAAREQQCPALHQKIYYFLQSAIILEILFNSFTNIDVVLFLLSHPFPALSTALPLLAPPRMAPLEIPSAFLRGLWPFG